MRSRLASQSAGWRAEACIDSFVYNLIHTPNKLQPTWHSISTTGPSSFYSPAKSRVKLRTANSSFKTHPHDLLFIVRPVQLDRSSPWRLEGSFHKLIRNIQIYILYVCSPNSYTVCCCRCCFSKMPVFAVVLGLDCPNLCSCDTSSNRSREETLP